MIKEIDRRIRNALSAIRLPFRVVLTTVNTKPGVSVVQAKGLNGEILQGNEMMQIYGFTSHPVDGTMGVVLPLGGKTAHGVIIATEHSQFRIKELKKGEVAVYSQNGDYCVFKENNIIEFKTKTLKIDAETAVEIKTKTLTVEATSMAEFKTPLLKVTNGDVKADDISLIGHKHGKVTVGLGQTDVPV